MSDVWRTSWSESLKTPNMQGISFCYSCSVISFFDVSIASGVSAWCQVWLGWDSRADPECTDVAARGSGLSAKASEVTQDGRKKLQAQEAHLVSSLLPATVTGHQPARTTNDVGQRPLALLQVTFAFLLQRSVTRLLVSESYLSIHYSCVLATTCLYS